MNHFISISSPEILVFNDEERLYYGADQDWYTQKWQQRAGCGPTVCSQLFWYLAQTRQNCRALCHESAQEKQNILLLMQDVWQFVTPGGRGTNSTRLFIEGALQYAHSKKISLDSAFLDVRKSSREKDVQRMAHFIQNSLLADLPVAFMNLSNGKEKELESWHWVVITGLHEDTLLAECFDNGNRLQVNLKNWLATTLMGGGFVSLFPAQNTLP